MEVKNYCDICGKMLEYNITSEFISSEEGRGITRDAKASEISKDP